MRKFVVLAVLLSLLALLVAPAFAQSGANVRIRVAHFSPDTPAVDVFVNGDAAIEGLEFPSVTDWIELPAGSYNIAVAPAGAGIDAAAIGPADFDLPGGAWITVAAIGSLNRGTLRPQVLVEDYSVASPGSARVSVFHGIEGLAPVDVLADGGRVVELLGFPGSLGGNDGKIVVDVPASTYDLQVIEARALKSDASAPDRVLFDLANTRLEPGVNYLVAAVGTPAQPEIRVVTSDLPGRSTSSIADLVVDDSRLSTLLAAVDAAGLVETLANEGPFTVFAPNNTAFAAALDAIGITAEDLLANTELLTQILLYHVVPGTFSASDLAAAGTVTTLEGSEITIEGAAFGATLNGNTPITRPDFEATNGIVHKINRVLLPPAVIEELGLPTQTIAEIAVENGSFNTLVAALDAAGLVPTFADENAGPFTVFAPTDDAFAAALEALGLTAEELLADTELLTTVLTYHVVEGEVLAETVVTLDSATTLQGSDISIAVVDGGVVLNDSVNVVATDIIATNGVIHVIDAVLLPPAPAEEPMAELPTIADIAIENDFTVLVAALDAAGLVPTFADENAGPFTVFAPTDDAFAAALEALGLTAEELLADTELLTTVLTYHVVEGEVLAETVVTLDSATTLQGSDISIAVVDGGVVLNDSVNVVATDIMASNGVVHVIDAVLLPPAAE